MPTQSAWLDLCVGVDVHIEMVPTPAPTPTPFPHPFAGVIADPLGFIVGEVVSAAVSLCTGQTPSPTGPVLISKRPASVTGDACNMPIKHIPIPPGVSFAVGLPPSDAELVVGSQTVSIMGASAVRMGEVALSCSEPIRLPTAQVISTFPGPPATMTGGPPGISWADVALMLGMRAVRTKWVSKKLHSLVDAAVPSKFRRARDMLHKAACFFTGHPVNVANGSVLTDEVDLELPGPLPLRFERQYSSNWCDRDSPLGFGWSHSLDQKLWLEPTCVALQTEDGREVEFDTMGLPDRVMRAGDTLHQDVDRLTLRSLGNFRWEVRTPDGIVKEFGPVAGESPQNKDRGMARLLRIRSRAGHAIQLAYDDKARLAEVRDAAGRTLRFEHGGDGRLRRLWAPDAGGNGLRQHAEYKYSPQGDLIEVRDAAGKSWSFEYDDHLLVRDTNRNGLSFYFVYDEPGPYGRCTRTWGDGGIYDHAIVYDRENRRTLVTNSCGETTVYEANPLGAVTRVVDPMGGATSYAYDHALRKTAEIDPLGNATRMTYDARGNLVMVVGPDKAITKIAYDDHDLPISIRTPTGGQWRMSYDSYGRLTARINPLGEQTTWLYEEGKLVAVVDAMGRRLRLEHDKAHNLTAVTTPDGATRRFGYDALGRVVRAHDVANNEERRTYDALGRLVRHDTPDGNTRVFAYDGEGNLVAERDRYREAHYTYAGLNRLASRTVGRRTTKLEYDTEDRVVAVVNERGLKHTFELAPTGRVFKERGFDGRERTYHRDVAGRVTQLVRPGIDKTTDFTYDPAGRVVEVTYTDAAPERYAYDEAGQLVEAVRGDVTVTFERDALGRVVEETAGEHSVQSRYDATGARIGLRSSLGADATFERDAMGDLKRVAYRDAQTSWEAAFRRNVFGGEVERTLPGGAKAQWWHDAIGRPIQHWIVSNEHLVRGRRYQWHPDDRLVTLHEEGRGAISFEHDIHGWLTKTTYPNGRVEHRSPDEVGNIFRTPDGSDRTYGDAGQLLELRAPEGATTYRYDASGNLAEKIAPDGRRWKFHFDGAGYLLRVDRPDGDAVAFEYDALGRRVLKNHAGAITRFVWDGDVVLHQWGETGEPPRPEPTPEDASARRHYESVGAHLIDRHEDGPERYRDLLVATAPEIPACAQLLHELDHGPTRAPDPDPTVVTWLFEPESHTPMARIAGATAHAILTDHLGTPLCALDPQGAIAWQGTHDTYGRMAHAGDPTLCPFRYPGQYEDQETNLHYNRFRYYDPQTATYLTPDPLGLRAGLQQYAYVPDPTTWMDPLGLSKTKCGSQTTEGGAASTALAPYDG